MGKRMFEINEKTGKDIDGLGKTYGVSTRAAVLKRAIALAITSAKYIDSKGTLIIRDMRPGSAPDAVVKISVRD